MPPATARAGVALRWDERGLSVLDQRLLPHAETWLTLSGAGDAAAAIRALSVRGAPLIGIVAGYALALEASGNDRDRLERAWRELRGARPTAVNLAWAVDRVRAAALARAADGMAGAARAQAEAIHAEEDAASDAIAAAGADLLRGARRILTHCNSGALAAGGDGTGLAIPLRLHAEGAPVEVLVTETRPLLQGARLTVWELSRAGVPHALLVDGAAPGLIARGEVDAVVVGCDRVAANGDVANKVGTYGLALAANAAGVPFVVAGPVSTIDAATASGALIEIEERGADEVLGAGDATLPGTVVRNPAFDVTPASLVTALVTERGVAQPPDAASVARLVAAPAQAAR